VVGITTYTSLPAVVAWVPTAIAGMLLAGGLLAFGPVGGTPYAASRDRPAEIASR
jgi:hypothetical protein